MQDKKGVALLIEVMGAVGLKSVADEASHGLVADPCGRVDWFTRKPFDQRSKQVGGAHDPGIFGHHYPAKFEGVGGGSKLASALAKTPFRWSTSGCTMAATPHSTSSRS